MDYTENLPRLKYNTKTVRKGKAELSDLPAIGLKRIRKVGGGAKKK